MWRKPFSFRPLFRFHLEPLKSWEDSNPFQDRRQPRGPCQSEPLCRRQTTPPGCIPQIPRAHFPAPPQDGVLPGLTVIETDFLRSIFDRSGMPLAQPLSILNRFNHNSAQGPAYFRITASVSHCTRPVNTKALKIRYSWKRRRRIPTNGSKIPKLEDLPPRLNDC
jgi:hypothetical protein